MTNKQRRLLSRKTIIPSELRPYQLAFEPTVSFRFARFRFARAVTTSQNPATTTYALRPRYGWRSFRRRIERGREFAPRRADPASLRGIRQQEFRKTNFSFFFKTLVVFPFCFIFHYHHYYDYNYYHYHSCCP